MNLLKNLRLTFLTVCFVLTVFICKAEENVTPLLTTLSSTVISGYVDASAVFSNTNASAHGFAGTWIGTITDRSTTNRAELYVVIDENGNFAARAMNFDRTLGSGQLDGTLNDSGKTRIGQTRFHFLRRGVGTVIGRGENGRLFTA
jgi:hypothetical protein